MLLDLFVLTKMAKKINDKKLQIDISFVFIEFFNEYFVFHPVAGKKKNTIRADKFSKEVLKILKRREYFGFDRLIKSGK